jgi:hypothetical protein
VQLRQRTKAVWQLARQLCMCKAWQTCKRVARVSVRDRCLLLAAP